MRIAEQVKANHPEYQEFDDMTIFLLNKAVVLLQQIEVNTRK